MDITPRNSESTPIPEEQTAHSEENSLNVDILLKEDVLEQSNSTAGVYSRFKRRRRPKVRRGTEDTVEPERGMDHYEMETSFLKRSADSRVRSRHVAFDPIVREIPVSIQCEPLKAWTPDSDTEPMKGIPLDLEKETGATFNSFQRYNGLNPRDRHVSFNHIMEEITGQTEVLSAQGENDNRTHTAPERVFSGELFVIHRIVDHGWNALEEMLFQVNWFGFSPEENIWEPVSSLPRNLIIQYCRRHNIAITNNLGEAQEMLNTESYN